MTAFDLLSMFMLSKLLSNWQLSPCDLLNSRDQFRQKPPEGLPQVNYGEIEGFFGVLVTLYHLRKLLSSHGIKPAFEMLEEKFKQGYDNYNMLKFFNFK